MVANEKAGALRETSARSGLYGEALEVAVAVAVAVAVVLWRVGSGVVFGVVFSGCAVRVVPSVCSGSGGAGGAVRGRYTKKRRPPLITSTSTSVANTTVHFHLSNISKNLTFGKIAKEPEPRAI
jgi:hypothetical protein